MQMPEVRAAFTTSRGNRRCAVAWCFQDFEGFIYPVHRVLVELYYITTMKGTHASHWNFVEFSILIGEYPNSGKTPEPFGNDPEEKEPHFDNIIGNAIQMR